MNVHMNPSASQVQSPNCFDNLERDDCYKLLVHMYNYNTRLIT